MPIFEYRCRQCGHVSEFLESAGRRGKHPCQHCGSPETEKVLSGFAVGRSGCSTSQECPSCTNCECPHASGQA